MQTIFEKMIKMGWNLDDIEGVYNYHKEFLYQNIKKYENEELEDGELVYCSQFLYDFLVCLEDIMGEKEN